MLEQDGFLRLIRAQPVTMGQRFSTCRGSRDRCGHKVRPMVEGTDRTSVSNILTDTSGISRETRREALPFWSRAGRAYPP